MLPISWCTDRTSHPGWKCPRCLRTTRRLRPRWTWGVFTMSLSTAENGAIKTIFLLGRVCSLMMLIRPGNNCFRPSLSAADVSFNMWANAAHAVWKAEIEIKCPLQTSQCEQMCPKSLCAPALNTWLRWICTQSCKNFPSFTKRILVLVNDQPLNERLCTSFKHTQSLPVELCGVFVVRFHFAQH